jgi:hypothetical protein
MIWQNSDLITYLDASHFNNALVCPAFLGTLPT